MSRNYSPTINWLWSKWANTLREKAQEALETGVLGDEFNWLKSIDSENLGKDAPYIWENMPDKFKESLLKEVFTRHGLRVSYKVKRRAYSVISDARWIFRCLLTNLVEGGQLVHVRMGPASTMLSQAIERDARRFYSEWVADNNDTTVAEGAKGIIDRLVSMGDSERPKTLGKTK
jgi:hypothetical protein